MVELKCDSNFINLHKEYTFGKVYPFPVIQKSLCRLFYVGVATKWERRFAVPFS